jgi:hypothetical protein
MRRHQWKVLLAASYVFYLINSKWLVGFLLFTTVLIYFSAIRIEKLDLQKKEGELKQARMKQAELLMAVIEKDREYMKALLRRNYLLGRKMTLTRAFNAFRERFEPVKKQMNDGVADEMNKKAAITAGELEKAQAVLRSLSEKLRQMG